MSDPLNSLNTETTKLLSLLFEEEEEEEVDVEQPVSREVALVLVVAALKSSGGGVNGKLVTIGRLLELSGAGTGLNGAISGGGVNSCSGSSSSSPLSARGFKQLSGGCLDVCCPGEAFIGVRRLLPVDVVVDVAAIVAVVVAVVPESDSRMGRSLVLLKPWNRLPNAESPSRLLRIDEEDL